MKPTITLDEFIQAFWGDIDEETQAMTYKQISRMVHEGFAGLQTIEGFTAEQVTDAIAEARDNND